ncbi:hypothetical protein [Thauera sinica]|uniref:Uncharacterized protein n=1 Tax=Thauera sinica TaxID=2665146 RepID=A0ABW1ARD6_9RHOO|nr:hypothetical protein [Thauera sp. K11]
MGLFSINALPSTDSTVCAQTFGSDHTLGLDQNNALGLNVEFKTIVNEWSKKAGAALLDAGSAILGAAAIAGEVLDPTTYITSGSKAPEGSIPGPWWCLGCYSPPQSSAGGFLLYPNKANTNQLQSVYKKK